MFIKNSVKQWATISLFFFIWFALVPGTIRSQEETQLQKAQKLYDNGEYEEAMRILTDFIKKLKALADQKKNVAEAYYMLARIFYDVGDDARCDENLRRVFAAYADFTKEEKSESFQKRVEKVKSEVAAEARQAEELRKAEQEKKEVLEREKKAQAGMARKKKFPWLLALAGAVVVGVVVYLLLAKKKNEQPGSIEVSSTPQGASIFLDGVDTGKKTNSRLDSVKPGLRVLMLRLQGYSDYSEDVRVDSGQALSITHDFLTTFVFEAKWGSDGSGDGQFKYPYDIALDNNGYCYVTDNGNHCVQKFTTAGQFVARWGGLGQADGQFNYPMGIALDRYANVYVVDSVNYRIQKFNSSGVFLNKWGRWGWGDGQFYYTPCGVVVFLDKIYVSESNRIQVFDLNGWFLGKWGETGNGDGNFNYARGITADSQGNIYVVDSENSRVQKFNPSGQFLLKFGSKGSGGDGQLNSPDDVAVDNDGNIFVSDSYNNRIQKYTANGTFISSFGWVGSSDGNFSRPSGLAIDNQNRLYVADYVNHRIQKFRIK